MTKTTSRYTYTDFANDVIAIVNGEMKVTPDVTAKVTEKAQALLNAQLAKAAYNATHQRKSTAKGASAETQAKANAIASVLTTTPMTASEINTALGSDYTALQVANAVKFINGVQSTKVVRSSLNAKGLRQEKEYTAYFVG